MNQNNISITNNIVVPTVPTGAIQPKAQDLPNGLIPGAEQSGQISGLTPIPEAHGLPEKFNSLTPQTYGLFQQFAAADPGLAQLNNLVAQTSTSLANLQQANQSQQAIEDASHTIAQFVDYLNSANVGGEYGAKYAKLAEIVGEHQRLFAEADTQQMQLKVTEQTKKNVTNFGSQFSVSDDQNGSSDMLSNLTKNENLDFILVICIAVLLLVAKQAGKILKEDNDALTANSDANSRLVDANQAFSDLADTLPFTYTDKGGAQHTITDIYNLIRFAAGKSCSDDNGQTISPTADNYDKNQQETLHDKLGHMLTYLNGFVDPNSATKDTYLSEMLADIDPINHPGDTDAASDKLFTAVATQINEDLKKVKSGSITFFTRTNPGHFTLDPNTSGNINRSLSQGVTAGGSVSNQIQIVMKTDMQNDEGWFEAAGSVLSTYKDISQTVGRA
jgi:hypothetical protein